MSSFFIEWHSRTETEDFQQADSGKGAGEIATPLRRRGKFPQFL